MGLKLVYDDAQLVHCGEHNVLVILCLFERTLDILHTHDRVLKLAGLLDSGGSQCADARGKIGLEAAVDVGAERFLRKCGVGQLLGVCADGGENILPDHVEHRLRLDVQHLAVAIKLYLVAGVQLGGGVDAVAGEQLNVLVGEVVGDAVGRGAQVQQSAALGLVDPGLVVAVAVEDDALVLCDDGLYQIVQVSLKVGGLLQNVRVLTQRLGNGGVDYDVAHRRWTRRSRAYGTQTCCR